VRHPAKLPLSFWHGRWWRIQSRFSSSPLGETAEGQLPEPNAETAVCLVPNRATRCWTERCRIKIIECKRPEQLLVPRSRYLPLGFLR